jgi:Flp pilus assembly protein CpaB
MTYRIRNIAIAVALALVAGLLTIFYVTNYKRSVVDAESDVTVWVATSDIEAGASGDEIMASLKELEVAKKSVAPGAISDPAQIEDRVAATPIYAGEQITTRRFTTEEKQGVRAQLTGNERALQVSGSQHQLLAGTLRSGDRIDVVGSWNVPESDTRHFSRVVLRDILVLRAAERPSSTQRLSGSGPNGSTISVTLALTDAQSQKLFWLMQNGTWSLALRPSDDAADSPSSAENAQSLLLDGVGLNQLRALTTAERLLSDDQE